MWRGSEKTHQQLNTPEYNIFEHVIVCDVRSQGYNSHNAQCTRPRESRPDTAGVAIALQRVRSLCVTHYEGMIQVKISPAVGAGWEKYTHDKLL